MNNSVLYKTVTFDKFSLSNKITRLVWALAYVLLFRPFSLPFFRKWRVLILKIFGAKVSWTCNIYSSVKIWAPWNLEVGKFSCIGREVDCYNQGKIKIKSNATVSQKTYLCASSHDFTDVKHPLFLAPITIENNVWITADTFIGPGVTIGEGAVVGARAAVFKNVEPWTVVGGNPAKFLKVRIIKS